MRIWLRVWPIICWTETVSGSCGTALDTALTLEDARKLAEEGSLTDRILAPDMPLGHLQAVTIPAEYAKQVAAGANIPAEGIAEDVPETENLRVYLNGQFWGIMYRHMEMLVWKVQIAPDPVAGDQ